MAKFPYQNVPNPPFRNGTSNPNNTDTRSTARDTHAREMDDDGVSNAGADTDYGDNMRKFDGSRCSDQTLPPTRRNGPSK